MRESVKKDGKLRKLLGCISPFVWLAQGAVLLTGAFLLTDEGVDPDAVCLIGPLLGCVSSIEVQRPLVCGKQKTGQSGWYDARQAIPLKGQITGVAALAVLLLLYFIGTSRDFTFPWIVMTLLVPYFLSETVYLLFLCRTDGKASRYVMIGAGVLLGIFFWAFTQEGNLLRAAYRKGELAALALLISMDLMLLALRSFRRRYSLA